MLNAALMLCSRFRFKVVGRLVTLLWRLAHLPYVAMPWNCYVAPSVRLRTFWSRTGRWQVKRRLQIRLGRNTRIFGHVLIQGSGRLTIGDNSYISGFSVVGVNNSVSIGNNVLIANAVTIRDTDHTFSQLDTPIVQQGTQTSPVIIEDDVWIGHGASILKGVTVGSGAVVAAGAVVIQDVPPHAVVGGVPARVLRSRSASP